MEYGMVSMLIPREYDKSFRDCSKHTMQDAANTLQWNLYQGLSTNLGSNILLFNILPCGSYPQYYSRPFVPRFTFVPNGENLSFCNIKVIRNHFKTKAIKKALLNWCQSNNEEKTLFIYTISHPILSAVAEAKNKYPQLQVCAIVADLPDMSNLSSKQGYFLRMFSARRAGKAYSLLSSIDYFVLLTKYMADYMHLYQPYCVMEGIATVQKQYSDPKYDSEIKTVFYAGTLHRKFGVLHLLQAFQMIEDSNYQLVLCGTGDCEGDIKSAAEKDSRIRFCGQLSRSEVLKLQSQATVLVNPRQNSEEFTKYSFPSKNLEYLSSGIPFVAYKLDGIPDEYDDYILYVKDNDVSSLSEKIIEVCQKNSQERQAIGMKAKAFVTEQKNEVVQTRKILTLLSKGGEKNGGTIGMAK